ncbi:MAG: hypothetical protein EOO10_13805, partial [Chitinophagaceae bacterium]
AISQFALASICSIALWDYERLILEHFPHIHKVKCIPHATETSFYEPGHTLTVVVPHLQSEYAINPFQPRVDKNTLDKITSVATSKGTFVKKLTPPPVDGLKSVTKELKLNTISPKVAELQKNLTYLGYQISETEFKMKTLGKTTTKALTTLQKANGIAITGHYDKATKKIVNRLIESANPSAVSTHRYRIRGSVRDQLWQRKNEMVIKIQELILEKEGDTVLGAKKVFLNGFFDIPYDAPVNPTNGQVKDNFHLVVKLFTAADQINPVATQKHFNVKEIHWVNFTGSSNPDGTPNYDGKYLGASQYEETGAALQKAIGNKSITELKETAGEKLISQISLQTGLSTDEIMCHVLASLVAKAVNIANPLSPELFYAFICQNLPPDLPGDLLRGTSDWETIAQLTELTSSGIAFLENAMQLQAIDNAVAQNLVSQKIKINRAAILQSLATLKTNFTLNKPILVGNGNLKSLLDISTVSNGDYDAVANVFIASKGINTNFWTSMKDLEAQVGAGAIADLTTTVEIANLAKNHTPTIEFIKNNTGPGKKFKIVSDVAKLDQAEIVSLINANGKKVPDNMPGNTVEEKVANFAAAIKTRSNFLHPAVSLVAATKKINPNAIPNINAVEQFIDEQKDLNFREDNIDKYIKVKSLHIDAPTKAAIKLTQRIQKLTTNPVAGSALLDERIHSSMQLYFMGNEKVKTLLSAKGVEDKHIHHLYESSKMQYMKILARITDFRREMYRDTPVSIISPTYTADEIQNALGDIPDLETLFGSLDYCECDHCKSLYGPAAYLTDMLRFLKTHLSTDPARTVKDILFYRRPDIGNIKLNCVNTNSSLPYIDLVCEILENNLIGNKNFVYQTTLSQKELRAIPENIQPAAYTELAGKDYPMNGSFNLWREEARTYLNYLRVPRYELMEAFQNKINPAAKTPDDSTIAAEYFKLSWKENDLITNSRPAAVDQTRYWGFDTNQNKMAVSLFMKRSKLTYYEVLELLMIGFVNDPAINRSTIERNLETCDTDKQSINNLTLAKFDLMHRFIRLWRKSGWKMWELDLLLRNPKIGNNLIDRDALIKLKLFKQLQEKLKLPFEILLAFYSDISREIRIKPDKQDVIIQPLYNNLFQNISITNPVDIKFKAIGNLTDKLQPVDLALPFNPLVLDATILLKLNPGGYNPVPTILSSLALSQADFDLIAGKTDKHLSIASLSTLLRYVYLAKGLKLSITDLLLLLTILNTNDPFADLQTTVTCLENLKQIKQSGLSILQLDYILNYRPDSSIGLRDETLAQLIDGLRRI